MTDSLVVQLRQALAAWDDGTLDVVATVQAMNALRAALAHLDGEQQRIARAWDEGSEAQRTADVLGVQVFANPYRREEQTNG